ncbi:MAG: hypothetical protein M0Q99_10065 [Candidatus Cloacimonetes bacterium]|jgi:hypothetical protein|nr:hypothetical protein [Candidatus Cloacimonadota bacterium]
MDSIFALVIILTFVIVVIVIQRRNSSTKTNPTQAHVVLNNMLEECQQLCDRAYEEQKMPEVSLPFQIKKGEKGYIKDRVDFHEQRSKSVSTRGGGAIRVAKGIYLGGSQGTSRSVPEMRMIDQGNIFFTNQRILFIGENAVKEYPLKRIISISTAKDGFWIASEGKQKRQFFKTYHNPMLWDLVLRMHNEYINPTLPPPLAKWLFMGIFGLPC